MANDDNDGAALGRHHPPWIPTRPRMEGGSKEGGRLLAFLLGPTSAILARMVRNLMKVWIYSSGGTKVGTIPSSPRLIKDGRFTHSLVSLLIFLTIPSKIVLGNTILVKLKLWELDCI